MPAGCISGTCDVSEKKFVYVWHWGTLRTEVTPALRHSRGRVRSIACDCRRSVMDVPCLYVGTLSGGVVVRTAHA